MEEVRGLLAKQAAATKAEAETAQEEAKQKAIRDQREQRTAELYGQGLEYLDSGNPTQALSAFEEIERIQPGYRDTALLMEEARGLLAKQAAEAEAAQEEAKQKAIREQREQRTAELYGQGLEYLDSGDPAQALGAFEEIERLQPGYRDTALLMREVRGLLAKQAAAAAGAEAEAAQEEAKQKAIREQREQRTAELYGQGLEHLYSGDMAQALSIFEKIEGIQSDYRDTALLMGEVRRLLAKQAAAAEVAQEEARRKADQERVGAERRIAEVSEPAQPPSKQSIGTSQEARVPLDQRATTITAANAERVVCLRTLKGHKDPVRGVAFSPDSRLLASASWDKTVRVWQVLDGALVQSLTHPKKVECVAFSPDGAILATGSQDKVRLWQVHDATLLQTFGETTTGLAFSVDGRTLASGSGTVRLWQVVDGRPLSRLGKGANYTWNDVAFSPDGAFLALATSPPPVSSYTVDLFRPDAKGWTAVRSLKGHVNDVKGIAFSPDGTLLAAGSSDQTVFIWACG